MTQLEFYKSFQFVAELIIAEALFCLRLNGRSKYFIRLPFALAGVVLFSFLFPIITTNAFYISFTFFCIFVATFVAAIFLYKERLIKLLFCMLAGYTVQHTAYELYSLTINLMGGAGQGFNNFYSDEEFVFFGNPFFFVIYLCVYFATYFIAALLLGRKIERGDKLHITNLYIFIFAILLLSVDIIINAIVVFYVMPDGNTLYLTIMGAYNIICCAVVLLLMFEVALRQKLEDTLHTVNLIRRREREQFKLSKENIELINMKCHDLKHQIHGLGASGQVNAEALKELEGLISIYDASVHTGNDVLDVILMEKLLRCNEKGIRLSCIVDGKQLTFMREGDIYSLFGNIIENAIEAVLPLEPSKRVITLKAYAINDMISVNLTNYFSGKLEFEDGLPVTTKLDKKYHGFGMKSVKYVCSKYGGDVSVSVEDNVFNLNLMFLRNAE